mmetsp:Transcript_35774/g.50687  ORF Transcript_35774/g.50687 Transcript_35774/m.50687 type:complete len:728 (-) Transcript_35774:229-2412(-)
MAEIRSTDHGLCRRFIQNPTPHVRALEAACHALATELRPGYEKDNQKVKVGLSGPVGAAPLTPRELNSAALRQLICVEGVATKVSSIKPKIVQSVHYCPETQEHLRRDYVDATDPHLGLHRLDTNGREAPDKVINITSSVYPTKDKDGNSLETEFGLSTFKDHQTITLQEMPEKAPMGQLPRSVELILDHDLVDRIKPGDRVQVVGIFRALASSANGQASSSSVFPTVVLANNVQVLGYEGKQLAYTKEDVRAIKDLSQRQDILDVLGRSFASSILGHEIIKKALVLQQLSGVEKNLENGTHLRGDINIMMVGDPSTAKSQLLRSAMSVAPLAISTTGKGSSGVGLTAAVTSDKETREKRLEAGAMVLADRGLVCVDEFDKMGENDRVAIHEAMEQQTVTIAKAGLHASLNARCSVLAAANPVYGQYNRKKRMQENIGLPDSLLSRFDLLFVVLDDPNSEVDRKIAEHVIRGHQYRSAEGKTGHDSDEDSDDESVDEQNEDKKFSIWQRSHHANYTLTEANDSDDENSLSDVDPDASNLLKHDFLRKYLHFSKTRMAPTLTDAAREEIASRYAEMRSRQDERTLPITARSLETVIRLATAHAKARLSKTVEAVPDVVIAMDIISFALYHEKVSSVKPNKTNAQGNNKENTNEPTPETGDQLPLKRPKLDQIPLKNRISQQLKQNQGLSIDELCPDVSDRKQVDDVVAELSESGRLLVDENRNAFWAE